MAPPSDKHRLSQITPQQAAAEATSLLSDHCSRLLLHLDPGIVWQRPSAEGSSIGFTAALLTEYARTGRDPEESPDAPGAVLARDRIQDLCSALYSQAGRPGTFQTPDLDVVEGEEPEDVLGVVLVAAWARIGLDEERALTKRELGCLASLSVRRVYALCSDGEIAVDADGRVPAAEARRWLASRGVAGV